MRKRKEKIYYLLYCIFGRNLPMSYRCNIAKNIRAYFARKILKYAGDNINIETGAEFSGKVSLGNNSGIGIKCELSGDITIGDNVMMGPNVTIYSINHETDRIDIPMNEQGFRVSKEVVINNDVWIGKNVIILPGVSIGEGCIIGAGAVVTRSVPAYSIAAGNPAKVVKSRI